MMNKGIRFCWNCHAKDLGYDNAKSYLESFEGIPCKKVAESLRITPTAYQQVRNRFGVKLNSWGGVRVKL